MELKEMNAHATLYEIGDWRVLVVSKKEHGEDMDHVWLYKSHYGHMSYMFGLMPKYYTDDMGMLDIITNNLPDYIASYNEDLERLESRDSEEEE